MMEILNKTGLKSQIPFHISEKCRNFAESNKT